MVTLRFAVPAILAVAGVAAVAGCLSYFVTLPVRVESDLRKPPAAPYLTGPNTRASTRIDQSPTADELAAEAYQNAAEAILRRAPNARASAANDEPPLTGPIPLPKRRPIAR